MQSFCEISQTKKPNLMLMCFFQWKECHLCVFQVLMMYFSYFKIGLIVIWDDELIYWDYKVFLDQNMLNFGH